MKECVYGWYPPAREVLKTHDVTLPGESSSKPLHIRSEVKTPICSQEKWRTPSPKQLHNSWSRSLSRTSPARGRSKSAVISLEIRGEGHKCSSRPSTATTVRSTSTFNSKPTPDQKLFSVAPPGGRKPRPPGLGGSRPVKVWQTKTTETNHIPDFQDYLREIAEQCESAQLKLTPQYTPQPQAGSSYGDMEYVNGTATHMPSERRERIKSATTYRPKVQSYRPIRSAGPTRYTTPVVVIPDLHEGQDKKDIHEDDDYLEVEAASEVSHDDAYQKSEVDEELGVDNPLDYEEQLEKYGWRMQVHGDPLNLKRPCIAKRRPYTEKLPIPGIPLDPPQAHSECYDTFFYNTIPRRRMTFAIDKEWASEVLHAKRMELQKRDGDTYRYRTANFSFVY